MLNEFANFSMGTMVSVLSVTHILANFSMGTRVKVFVGGSSSKSVLLVEVVAASILFSMLSPLLGISHTSQFVKAIVLGLPIVSNELGIHVLRD